MQLIELSLPHSLLQVRFTALHAVLGTAHTSFPGGHATRLAERFTDAPLTSRIAALLAGLPHLPAEPTSVRLEPCLLSPTVASLEPASLCQLGRLVAVRPARAADVLLTSPRFALSGRPLRLTLALAPAFGCRDTDDLPATLSHLVQDICAALSLDGAILDAPLCVTPDSTHICVTITI